MTTVENSPYKNQVLKKHVYAYGTFYLLDQIVISEINPGVHFTWEEAKPVIDDVTAFYGERGDGLVYISNRIHKYSVSPMCWLHFFKANFSLKAYGIVSDRKTGFLMAQVEKLFFKSTLQHKETLSEAINWAQKMILTGRSAV